MTTAPPHAEDGGVSPQGSAVQLLGPKEIRELAEKLDVSPTKKLGQNFLHDPNTVRMIIAAAEITATDDVIEIGPGLGSLTLGLLEVARSVTVVEIDPRLAGELPATAAARAGAAASTLSVHNRNALEFQRSDCAVAPTVLAANLPYNVSVPVLMHILAEFPSLRRVLVMVQKEVADRLAAAPGSKIYGVPSVKAAYYGQVRRAGLVGKNVFWPAPKIDSGLVRIDCYERENMPWQASAAEVFPIVDAAFAQRRKTLRAALSGHFGSGERSAAILSRAGIDPTLRGERLGVREFVDIALAAREEAAE
ncbi:MULTISPECIES: 16S rRNA (adenine(1518)-N(6)/adenine(1519)-N(6))-dimethyltransferase RsmA [unclassified Corynebacterium]|uniref:16S rRNA (adenine(1518)-N(6)/adenine(1519)-N(6))- dimethyltransferase RsmA n=1 Tax=unclassified Corynebacterium TaxID=2624378 RepID=UPI001C482963|nr:MULTISPECIES: 16S rRNA (adenine(1518)-N(6)/adenine(1519)-N(6))-dimethyltransferase RsmA [unclassified Corynebacterium]MBV7281303.1 16S rRNA (adenine(1518)-N(6)/adenine(1519)-N(6))-dimethyltransferase RsmA [Corynebacterium sp. TAE3-ERU30]MBV7301873.1 16S rRNA (adenine(1518)-N(6)/adenine(1519)-N(6))-dimethyltransferase RsmA [Corynebacterium sp. TAE3-ERU2]